MKKEEEESNDPCGICLEGLKEQKTLELSCGHEFHQECIITYFRKGSSSCPYCRDDPYKNNNIESINDDIHLRRRERFREMRERQGISQRVPEVKKLLTRFRDSKTKLLNIEKQISKEFKTIRHKYKKTKLRRNMHRQYYVYIKKCEENRNFPDQNRHFVYTNIYSGGRGRYST